ncbi:cell division protein FtsQ/DivIB [Angustibacter luteus]|uniref:Cell division protein FtsQ/DivIB n=1 Tax=Angustibacter luteus TaxID=658456 RepID=A0ABW1J8Q6_9ACTN
MSTRTTSVRESGAETSARFEARARAARWRARRPVLVTALVVVALLGLGLLAYAGPLLTVRTIEVRGVTGTMAEQVRQAAAGARGEPLGRVDTGGLGRRVKDLPQVADVSVERGWPTTLRLVVRPRVAVAAVPSSGGGYRLVDASGVAFEAAAKAPKGLPVLRVPVGPESADTLSAALTVLDAVPAGMRSKISRVSATSPDDVQMRWGAATVVWGSAQDSELKAEVLTALSKHRATVYDVSSPHTPVLR